MVELITNFGLGSIIIVLLITIPSLFNFIGWCKKMWEKREKFKQDSFNKGHAAAEAEEKEDHRFTDGEVRIAELEKIAKDMQKMWQEQMKINDRITRSDKLAIKTWIKEQHGIWMKKGCIDSQTLELLEERYEIYKEEGGNSWAKRLMDDLRSLPVAIIIPISEIHEEE